MSLSRLNHWLSRSQAHPEAVQGRVVVRKNSLLTPLDDISSRRAKILVRPHARSLCGVHEPFVTRSAALPVRFMGQTDLLRHENGRGPRDTLILEWPHARHSLDSPRPALDQRSSILADSTGRSG